MAGFTGPDEPDISFLTALYTYFGYGVLIFIGHVRDFLDTLTGRTTKKLTPAEARTSNPKEYAPLLRDFEEFYTRRLYKRIYDCWNRPITSCPGAYIDVKVRGRPNQSHDLSYTGEERRCLNLGSYNYLGFGDPNSPTKPHVFKAVDKWGITTSSFRVNAGTTKLHQELEETVAKFVGKEAAIVFGMGFGTNSTGVPALVGKGDLIISDSNNHSCIVAGARSSGASIKVFEHNDPRHLEKVVRRSIINGQPRTHRPWKRILILVEGIYSMEGEMCPLKEIVEVKKKYRCYLYVDEAHSIGALGHTGRGICQKAGVDTADIDVMMGTFTKSFGAVGGYLASSKRMIKWLRMSSSGSMYSPSISPPACQQIISALQIIAGEDGTDIGQRKIKQLRNNSNFFRQRMKDMGCHVLGDWDSPIVPVMLYLPAKIAAFSRECLERNLAVVVVGFPAAPLLLARTRFCISAAHTREDLEDALVRIEEVCDVLSIKYAKTMI